MAFFKKLLNRIFQFRIYRRIIASFGLVFITTVTVLSCLLFYLFSSSTTKEIAKTSKQMLVQTSYASEVICNQVTNLSNQLINDNNIITFLYSKENDKIADYLVFSQLTKIQNIYPFIKSIGIYNLQNGLNIDTEGIPIDNALLSKYVKNYIEIFPRKVTINNYDRRTSYELITFIIFPEFSLSKQASSAIVFNVDQSYILNTASSISGISPGSSTFVIDSGGLILSHIDANYFMQDLSNQDYISRILKGNDSQGSFVSKIDSKKHLVTYIKSSKVNWYFVSIKQYDQLLNNISELRNIVLLIALLLIIIGIVMSFLLTGAIYNPIRSLMEKVGNISSSKDVSIHKFDEYKYLSEAFSKTQESEATIKSSIRKSSQLVKENYIHNMLKGNPAQPDTPPEVLEDIIAQFTSPYYCLIIFKIDNYHSFKQDIAKKDQALFRFAICNISQELLAKHFRNEAALPEEDEVAVLAQLTENSLPQEIYLTLAEIQEAMRNYFKFTISVCIGEVLYSANDISGSYKALQEIFKYRLFYGRECIMDSEKVKEYTSRSSLYPFDLEKKLVDALHLCNNKLIQKYINDFIDYISRVNYFQAINYSNQLIISIAKSFDNLFDIFEDSLKNYFDVIVLINRSETIQDICRVFNELCAKICTLVEEQNTSINNLRYKKIIDDVRNYILKNYSNPNLSLELVSDVVELSPGYLGKLYKSITSISFNEYLNDVRLKKARELLCTTNEPASKICEKVGIFNVTYFSTLFKKTYGMTPSQFRGTNNINIPG